MIRLSLTVGALAILTACSVGSSVQSNQWRSGVPSSFAYAGATAPVPTIMVGNPFPVQDAAVSRVIVETSKGSYGGGSYVTFVSSTTTDGLRVVWHLSAPLAQSGQGLCAGPVMAGAAPATGGAQRIMGAFCSGAIALADVTVRLPAVPVGPDDLQWRNAFPQALSAMVPMLDPYEDME